MTIKSKPASKEYRDNYDRIFKRKKSFAFGDNSLCDTCKVNSECFTGKRMKSKVKECEDYQDVSR